MKKIIYLLLLMVFTSCSSRKNATREIDNTMARGSVIIELTARGKTHEYLFYSFGVHNVEGGMVHLPECKYCQKKDSLLYNF